MKARIFLLLLAAAMVAFGLWSISRRGARVHARPPGESRAQAEVPIQNGKTLDFSTGKAVVKDSPKERAALEHSVSEMDAAAGNVTFTPKPAPGATTVPAAKK